MNEKMEQILKRGIKTMRDGELARSYVELVHYTNKVFENGLQDEVDTYPDLEAILEEEMARRFVERCLA